MSSRLPRMPTESFCCSAVASIARGELSQAELEQLPPSTIDSTPPIDSPHTCNRGGERLAEMLDALSNFAEAGRAPADLIIAYELLRKSREA
jgi:hypothetical protein